MTVVRFWSCPYFVIMKRHTSTFVGFARGYKTTGNRWRGLCPSGTVKRNAHLRICQWTLTYFWSKHPSCRVCAVARIDPLCYFDLVSRTVPIEILSEECCRFFVWYGLCLNILHASILCRYSIVSLSLYIYTYICILDTLWSSHLIWHDMWIHSSRHILSHIFLRLAAAPEFGECLKQVLAETRSKRPESLYRSELDPKT